MIIIQIYCLSMAAICIAMAIREIRERKRIDALLDLDPNKKSEE